MKTVKKEAVIKINIEITAGNILSFNLHDIFLKYGFFSLKQKFYNVKSNIIF